MEFCPVPRMTLNLCSSCLIFLCAEIISMYHYAQLQAVLVCSSMNFENVYTYVTIIQIKI